MEESGYILFGSYVPLEAQQLFEAFAKGNIRFMMAEDQRLLKSMVWSPQQIAMHGGWWGQKARIAIAVHEDDVDEACRIRDEILNIMP